MDFYHLLPPDSAKKSTTYAIETASNKTIKKTTEVTGD